MNNTVEEAVQSVQGAELTGEVIPGTKIPLGVERSKETVSSLTEIVTLTPELAKQWKGLQEVNRPLKSKNISYLIYEMTEERWELNGETIKFDIYGVPRDCGHRLEAVILSGVSVDIEVIGGLAPSTIETIDTGASRSISDILSIDKVEHANQTAPTIKLIMQIRAGSFSLDSDVSTAYPDNRDVRAFAQQHRDELRTSVLNAVDYRKQSGNPTLFNLPIVGALLHLSGESEDMHTFINNVVAGQGLEPETAQFVLYTWLVDVKNPLKKTVRASKKQMLAAWIKSFNAFVGGTGLTRGKMVWNELKDEFPELSL